MYSRCVLEVLIGYGPESGRRLAELSATVLAALAKRYPFSVADANASREKLLATVAVHAEVKRRDSGGVIELMVPGQRELAAKIIATGFQQVSKLHHPDKPGGNAEAQKMLGRTRDALFAQAKNLPDRFATEDRLVIAEKGEERAGPWATQISDDDIPF